MSGRVTTTPDAPAMPAAAPTADDRAARAVVERMMSTDAFSQWLGVELLDAGVKRAVARMAVRDEMVNGFGTAHGGIVYSLADSVFAFATNSNGQVSVAVDCSMSYPTAVRPGDVLTATGIEQSSTRRFGFCEVTIRNQRDEVVGHFRGTIYRTLRPLFAEDEAGENAVPHASQRPQPTRNPGTTPNPNHTE